MAQTPSEVKPGGTDLLGGMGLCLLSLDGGGVRGLSTLYILKGIMTRLNQERGTGKPLKPCEVFDLIGGTSTGGLIAIMLGRLEMDIDECIAAYKEWIRTVFEEKSRKFPTNWRGDIKPQFESGKLKGAVEQLITDCGFSTTELLNDGKSRRCLIFVCATGMEISETTRFRSYSLPDTMDNRATITDAALATSAATGFFSPVQIGDRQFADGALGANNPVDEVEEEASDIWCPETRDLKRLVKCFVSIGTGKPNIKEIGNTWARFISHTLASIVTETERTEKKFIARWAQHYDEKRFFRFNVEQGLQRVGLDEYKEQGTIESATEVYLRHTQQKLRIRDCAVNLAEKERISVEHCI